MKAKPKIHWILSDDPRVFFKNMWQDAIIYAEEKADYYDATAPDVGKGGDFFRGEAETYRECIRQLEKFRVKKRK